MLWRRALLMYSTLASLSANKAFMQPYWLYLQGGLSLSFTNNSLTGTLPEAWGSFDMVSADCCL